MNMGTLEVSNKIRSSLKEYKNYGKKTLQNLFDTFQYCIKQELGIIYKIGTSNDERRLLS